MRRNSSVRLYARSAPAASSHGPALAGVFEFFLTFLIGVALLLGAFEGVLGVVLGLFGLGLPLSAGLSDRPAGKHAVQPLVIVGHMIARGINDFFRDAKLRADENALDLPGTPTLSL